VGSEMCIRDSSLGMVILLSKAKIKRPNGRN
jgi:hypothetical protein